MPVGVMVTIITEEYEKTEKEECNKAIVSYDVYFLYRDSPSRLTFF